MRTILSSLVSCAVAVEVIEWFKPISAVYLHGIGPVIDVCETVMAWVETGIGCRECGDDEESEEGDQHGGG